MKRHTGHADRRAFLRSALLCAALSLGGPAYAQAPSEREVLAQQDVDAGVKHFAAGQYHEAYVRLKSAAGVYPSPHIRANMVRAGSKSTYPLERVESARVARALLREGKLRADDEANVRAALERLQPELGRIEVRGVKSETVRADGELLDAAVLADPLDVLPGKHEIVVGSERHQIGVEAGETRTVTLGVAEAPEAPQPKSGGPVVSPPQQGRKVPRDGRPIVVGVLGGLAVASLGTALATTLVALGSQSDTRDETRSPTDRADSRSTYDSLRTASTITTWTGVGLGVVAGAAWFLWPTKTVQSSASGWSVAPVLSPTGVGVSGKF